MPPRLIGSRAKASVVATASRKLSPYCTSPLARSLKALLAVFAASVVAAELILAT